MFTFLVVLILIIAGLLILAVLVQNSKKEGLGNVYFGGEAGASQIMGVKKTSDLLEQMTWGLVIALFVLTLVTALFLNKKDAPGALQSSPNIDRAQECGTLPGTTTKTPTAPEASNQSPED
jgi:preprotein translocase subunit SecG